MKTKPIPTPTPTPIQPSPLRRETIREAPTTIRSKFDMWLLRKSNLKAVLLAVENGWRVERSDLATPITDKLESLTDPGQIATVRVTNSIALIDETAAMTKIRSLEALAWSRITRAEENQARIDNASAKEAQRQAAIDTRLVELRAKREAEAEAQLRRDAEYGNRGDAA